MVKYTYTIINTNKQTKYDKREKNNKEKKSKLNIYKIFERLSKADLRGYNWQK